MRYVESHELRYAKEWVEYFGKFGTQHLTPRVQYLPLLTREDFDIKALIGGVIFAILFTLWTIIKSLIRCLIGK